MNTARTFPVLLEAFFIDRLMRQRQVSPHTLASYRDLVARISWAEGLGRVA
jgi:integrase/recombinase XerD